MPFAGYDDFSSCVSDNQDKDSPEGFCSHLHKEATGEYPNQSGAFDDPDEHLRACVAGAVSLAISEESER